MRYEKLVMTNDMATRLRKARINAGHKSLRAAAQAKGWTYSTVAGHENGTEKIPLHWLETYADAYKVTYEWLRWGKEQNFTKNNKNAVIAVPLREIDLFSISDLSAFKCIQEGKMPQVSRKTVIDQDDEVPPHLFGVRIEDKAMMRSEPPSLVPGATVFVDPDASPEPGDLILAVLHGYAHGLVRRYGRVIEGGLLKVVLSPYNAAFETVTFAPDLNNFIVGKVDRISVRI